MDVYEGLGDEQGGRFTKTVELGLAVNPSTDIEIGARQFSETVLGSFRNQCSRVTGIRIYPTQTFVEGRHRVVLCHR